MSRERLKRIWTNMKHRCHGKGTKDKIYKYYRDRGIRVCDEWLHDYKAFESWSIEHGYAENLTIDRIDCDRDYCPENCRWVTNSENSKNKYHSGWLRPGLVRIKVNSNIKKILDCYGTLNEKEKKALDKVIEAFVKENRNDRDEAAQTDN